MAEDMSLNINVTGTNSAGGAFESLDASIVRVQTLVNDVSRSFTAFGETVQRAMSSAGGGGQQMESSLNSAQNGLRNASGAADNMNQSIDRLGRAMSAEIIGQQLEHIGEVGMHAFEACIQSAATFEFNISRIGAVLTTVGKASNQQMGQMSEDALKIGSNSSFSANQIAEGMYTLARQGLDASTILGDGVNGAINIVNDLAQATDSEMTDTATVITDVVHEYGLSGSELRNVANIMSGTLHNSSESLDDFYQSMKQVGPVASNMHQNVADMSTALALLAQHGITGSSAGTALKNMLLGLEPRTKKAADLMKELGISAKEGAADSFYQLNGNLKPLPDIIGILNDKFGGLNDKQKQAALAATFTKYGLAGLNTVVGESKEKFVAFQEELKKDDAATIAAKKMDNLHGDLLKFNAGVQTMMKSFGDSIGGMLRPLVQHASEAIKWLAELPKPIKTFGMVLTGLVSVLAVAAGGFIAFVGSLGLILPTLEMAGVSTVALEGAVAGLAGMFTTVLIPILAVVAAVAAVGLGFKLAYDHIKPFHDAVNNVIGAVKQVGEALKGMWQGGAGEGKGISILDNLGFSPAAISAVQNVFARIKEGVAGLKQGFDNVKSATQGIFMILSGTGGGKGISILDKLGFSKETIGSLMRIGGQFKATFDGIKNTVTSAINGISDIVRPILTSLLDFWNTHQYQFRQTVDVVWNVIGDVIRTVVSVIIKVISGILDTGQTVFDGIAFVVKKAKDAFQEAKKKVEEIAKTLSDFKDNVVKKLNEKFDDLTDAIKKHKTAIEVTAGVLTTIFGPALVTTGVKAAIAGGKLAAEFIVNVVKSGTEAVIAGAKLVASFIANIIKIGVEAVVAGAKLTAQFIAAVIQTGAEAVVAGAKLTVSLIATVIQLGIESVITAGKITGQAIVALIIYAAEGWKTAAAIGAQTTALVVNAASVVAQKVALFASTAATGAATAAQWLFNAALDANPIGIVILAIGALVAAGIYLYQNWDTVKAKMEGIWVSIERAAATAINGVIDKINGLIGLINKIPGVSIPIIPKVDWGAAGGMGDFQSLNRYASGTSFHPGGMALVGEEGPELVNLPRGAQVLPHIDTMSMLGSGQMMALPSGSGGGNVYNITVNANGNITRNEQQLGNIVSRAIFDKAKMQGRI